MGTVTIRQPMRLRCRTASFWRPAIATFALPTSPVTAVYRRPMRSRSQNGSLIGTRFPVSLRNFGYLSKDGRGEQKGKKAGGTIEGIFGSRIGFKAEKNGTFFAKSGVLESRYFKMEGLKGGGERFHLVLGSKTRFSGKGLALGREGKKRLDKLTFRCVYIVGKTEFPTLSRRNTDYQLVVLWAGGG